MNDTAKIAVVCGSVRKDSITRRVAHAVVKLSSGGFDYEFIDIGHLPLYNPDLETADEPEAWEAFRTAIRPVAGVLFATPEHNRSVPAALKNAIDIGSRPYGKSAWAGKPAAIMSVSPGNISGFGANHHLRQSLVFLNMPTMAQPEAYVGQAANLVGADGAITVEATRTFLAGFIAKFEAWVRLHAAPTS